jgi:hypothetical protein
MRSYMQKKSTIMGKNKYYDVEIQKSLTVIEREMQCISHRVNTKPCLATSTCDLKLE